jgi:hypothetical protein
MRKVAFAAIARNMQGLLLRRINGAASTDDDNEGVHLFCSVQDPAIFRIHLIRPISGT